MRLCGQELYSLTLSLSNFSTTQILVINPTTQILVIKSSCAIDRSNHYHIKPFDQRASALLLSLSLFHSPF